ncbi:hypothetical protein RMATCC62417_07805 [Rhizopus microsporus]|nr:hypothetical protein RMATCC62417_07805 [Rhizopus microsporus]
MSKRSNEETVVKEGVNKRSKTESHAPDCTDETCTGCDIGEVEIAFTNKTDDGEVEEVQPNAHELMVLAIDEAQEGDNDMARRLFDMSLEKFQQDEPDNRTGYAACLVQLGKTIGVEESLREGLDILRGERNKDSTLKLKVAYAALALANYLRMQQIATFAPQEANLYQENAELDEDAYEELLSKQKVTPDEEKLYKEAIDLVREAIKDAPLSDIQSVISELRTYALSLDLPVQKDHANVVLDATIEFIQQVPEHQDNWELVTVWAACLAHQEKVVDGTQKRVEVISKAIEMAEKANQLHVDKVGKDHPFMWELLAGLLMTQISLVDDEDEVMALYERAVSSFKKAHELAPEKVELLEMIKVIEEMKDAEGNSDSDDE